MRQCLMAFPPLPSLPAQQKVGPLPAVPQTQSRTHLPLSLPLPAKAPASLPLTQLRRQRQPLYQRPRPVLGLHLLPHVLTEASPHFWMGLLGPEPSPPLDLLCPMHKCTSPLHLLWGTGRCPEQGTGILGPPLAPLLE